MSFDPSGQGPQRPRSTPIPGAEDLSAPAPTPAQFLGEQNTNLPWTPLPGQNVNVGMSPGLSFGQPVVRSSSIKIILIVTLVLTIGGAVGIALIVQNAVKDATKYVPSFPTSVTFFEPSAPTFAVPGVPGEPSRTTVPAIPPGVTIAPGVTVATVATVPGLGSTAPTPPPTTVPAPPATDFPGGVSSLFEGGAARAVADQLAFVVAGAPFTQVVITPDFAAATAADPADPGQLIGAYWRDGAVSNSDVTGGGGDLSVLEFAEGDVNWDALSTLVPTAPGLLGLADGQVTQVQIQRAGVGNPVPVVIDVYVDGPSGKGYVEASATGDVLSVHSG